MFNWLKSKTLTLSSTEETLLFDSINTYIEKQYELQESYPANTPSEMLLLCDERVRVACNVRDKLHNYFHPQC